MNKYTELSDFEINVKVAEELYYKFKTDGELVIVTEKYVGCVLPSPIVFNPCNNPVYAMPIIIENKIAFMPSKTLDSYYCVKGDYSSINKSLYRAAMEVFLMMRDEEMDK